MGRFLHVKSLQKDSLRTRRGDLGRRMTHRNMARMLGMGRTCWNMDQRNCTTHRFKQGDNKSLLKSAIKEAAQKTTAQSPITKLWYLQWLMWRTTCWKTFLLVSLQTVSNSYFQFKRINSIITELSRTLCYKIITEIQMKISFFHKLNSWQIWQNPNGIPIFHRQEWQCVKTLYPWWTSGHPTKNGINRYWSIAKWENHWTGSIPMFFSRLRHLIGRFLRLLAHFLRRLRKGFPRQKPQTTKIRDVRLL